MLATRGMFPRRMAVGTWGSQRMLLFVGAHDLASTPMLGFALDDRFRAGERAFPDWYSAGAFHDSGVAIADLDGDGLDDVVVSAVADPTAEIATGGVRVHWGTPDGPAPEGTWVAGGPKGGGFGASGVAVGDMDADGRTDIAVSALWEASPPDTGHDHTRCHGRHTLEDPGLICLDGRPRLLRNVGDRAFGEWPWPLDSKSVAGTGAAQVLLADLDDDGALDVVLGSPDLATFQGQLGAAFPVKPKPWLAEYSDRFTYDLALLRRNGRRTKPYVVASRTCETLQACPSNAISGFDIDAPSLDGEGAYQNAGWAFASVYPSTLGELAAGVAAADLDGDGSDDLLGGSWTSAGRANLGGSPLVVYRSCGAPTHHPVTTSLPLAFPTTIGVEHALPMASSILTGRLCGDVPSGPTSTTRKLTAGKRRSIFNLDALAAFAVTGVNLVRPDGTTVPARDAGIRYTVASDHSWVALAPAVSGDDYAGVEITYVPLADPDVVVANGKPLEPSYLWCHETQPSEESDALE